MAITFHPYLTDSEVTELRRLFNALAVAWGTLGLLHVGAMMSVLPYVWVTDDAANCGARMILTRAVDGFYLLVGCWLGGTVLYALMMFFRPKEPRQTGGGGQPAPAESDINLFAGLVGAAISVALMIMVGATLKELQFLRNPPLAAELGCPSRPGPAVGVDIQV